MGWVRFTQIECDGHQSRPASTTSEIQIAVNSISPPSHLLPCLIPASIHGETLGLFIHSTNFYQVMLDDDRYDPDV